MKKITILLLLCFCAVGFVQAQQITEDSGTAASYEFNLDNSGPSPITKVFISYSMEI